jgi:hypothetical protein
MHDQHVAPTGAFAQESGFGGWGFCPGEGLQGFELVSTSAVFFSRDNEEGQKVFA